MKRISLTIGVVLLMACAFSGGLVVGRVTSDESAPETISDTEHSRLVEVCVDELAGRAECVAWVAELVEHASTDDLSYEELAALVSDIVTERQEQAIEAERRRTQRHVEELEAWVDRLDDQAR